jgi:hypothetical protein
MTTQEEARTGVQEEPQKKARSLLIKVVDNTRNGRPAVNVKVPIGVVKWGMKMAQVFSPDAKEANVDWESIVAMIEDGALGKIVDVDDEAANKTIEVWVE